MPRIVNGVVVKDEGGSGGRQAPKRRFRTLHDGADESAKDTRFNGGAGDHGGSSTAYFANNSATSRSRRGRAGPAPAPGPRAGRPAVPAGDAAGSIDTPASCRPIEASAGLADSFFAVPGCLGLPKMRVKWTWAIVLLALCMWLGAKALLLGGLAYVLMASQSKTPANAQNQNERNDQARHRGRGAPGRATSGGEGGASGEGGVAGLAGAIVTGLFKPAPGAGAGGALPGRQTQAGRNPGQGMAGGPPQAAAGGRGSQQAGRGRGGGGSGGSGGFGGDTSLGSGPLGGAGRAGRGAGTGPEGRGGAAPSGRQAGGGGSGSAESDSRFAGPSRKIG